MSYKQYLTPRETEIVDYFPATYTQMCDRFGFGKSTARDHVQAIERKGAPVLNRLVDAGDTQVKEFYLGDGHAPNKNDTRTYGSSGKATKTKKLNAVAQNLSERLDTALDATEPAVSVTPLSEGGEEDVAIHVTDDHIGDLLEDDRGNEIFNTEIAVEKIRHRVTRTLEIIERQEAAGWNFHTVHYIMGGDIITGSGIYDGQAWEVEKNFNEQIDIATSVHFDQIKRLADKFEAVQVICQTGNHGEIRISGSSEKANGDDIVYRMLDLAVRASEYDNITFVRNHRTNYINFEMRGHSAHLRHGKDMKAQSETRAASDDLRGWKLMHDFDVMYAGHFHIQSMDRVMEAPLIRSGSISPTDDFEESISEWSMPMSTVHGVSDTAPKTWTYDVQYDGDKRSP
jgi:hypothetical protein